MLEWYVKKFDNKQKCNNNAKTLWKKNRGQKLKFKS